MSVEKFQLLHNEPIDNSILNRDFLKVYHQRVANLNDSHQNVEFFFGEIISYHQVGNSYLEFDTTVPSNDNAHFDNDSAIGLTNNGLA